jgi:hypothetical protein
MQWILVVGSTHPVQRHISSFVARMFGKQLRFFESLPAALFFLQNIDPTLPALPIPTERQSIAADPGPDSLDA